MLAKRITQAIILCMAALSIHLALPATVFAQAWVPPKGDGSVSVTYQLIDDLYHVSATGAKVDLGHIRSHSSVMALEYGLTDKLALDLDLAFVASRYKGRVPHGPPDTGFYHPTFQNAHIGVRYNVLRRPLVLTPFIGMTLPTHAYEVRGHSAVGRGFKELLIGGNVGRGLDPILRDIYFHVRYSFALLKRFHGLNLNHTNVDAEVGWSPGRLITLQFIAGFQRSHGGFSLPQDIHDADDFDIHDRVARSNYLELGGGVSFSVTRSLDINAAYAPAAVYARNTHTGRGTVIGFTWRFSRGLSSTRISANTSSSQVPTMGRGVF